MPRERRTQAVGPRSVAGIVSRSVGERDEPFPLPHGREDEARHRGGPDQRADDGLGRKPRDICVPDLRLGSGIKVPTRDFR